MRILGIDPSTTTVGLAIITDKPLKLISCEYYYPDKSNDDIYMYRSTRDYIVNFARKHKVKRVAIENYIKYMSGASSANTVIPLAILNTIIKIGIQESLDIIPQVINVIKIRNKLRVGDRIPKKEEIPDIVANILNIQFPFIYNTKGNVKSESYDMADAIAVALVSIL